LPWIKGCFNIFFIFLFLKKEKYIPVEIIVGVPNERFGRLKLK